MVIARMTGALLVIVGTVGLLMNDFLFHMGSVVTLRFALIGLIGLVVFAGSFTLGSKGRKGRPE